MILNFLVLGDAQMFEELGRSDSVALEPDI